MEINITQEHIDKGERKNPKKCPISLALKEQFETRYTNVDSNNVTIGRNIHRMSPFLIHFVKNFDNGFTVSPGKYRIQDKALYQFSLFDYFYRLVWDEYKDETGVMKYRLFRSFWRNLYNGIVIIRNWKSVIRRVV